MPDSGDEERSAGQKAFAVVGYMVCSSLMLLANKLAIHYLQTPLFVLFAQLAGTAVVVVLARLVGLIQKPIFTSWKTALAFAPAPIAFLGTIYANIKVLQYANVETFIVFRSSTPLLISLADYAMLGREFPSRRSLLCLFIILLGAVGYTLTDSNFKLEGYFWVLVWYIIFSIDQLYIKFIIDKTKKLMTTWGRVFVTNALGAIILAPLVLIGSEPATLAELDWTDPMRVGWFVASCIVAVCMGYFAMSARTAVSATYFTVIGNVCKILTVFVNFFIWDRHASPGGLASLGVCLVAAYFYEQAPMAKQSGEYAVLPVKTGAQAVEDPEEHELNEMEESTE